MIKPTLAYCSPDKYTVLIDTTYSCIVCGAPVESQTSVVQDNQGNQIIVYTPMSRYIHEDGVFCGPLCSVQYYQGKSA